MTLTPSIYTRVHISFNIIGMAVQYKQMTMWQKVKTKTNVRINRFQFVRDWEIIRLIWTTLKIFAHNNSKKKSTPAKRGENEK